jgi:putative acetyltransferase
MTDTAVEYRIRPATNDDCPAVQAVVFAALREHSLVPEPNGTDLDLFDLEKSYFSIGGRFDVLEDPSGNVVGSVGLHRIDDHIVELRKMYLVPEHRGRGLGKRMLAHAMSEARRMGFKKLMLETQTMLKTAIAMYESTGFKRVGADIHTKRCDQIYELTL